MDKKSEPAWTFRPKHTQSKKTNNPGPGTYNAKPQNLAQTLPTFSISRGQRFQLNQKTTNPGPGTYIPSSHPRSRGGDIGKSNRPPLSFINSTPGPGNYETPPDKFQGPYFSIVTRHQKKTQIQTPGPGQYKPTDSHTSTSPQYKFGTRKRSGSVDLKSKVPGPDKYDLPSTLEHTSGKFGIDTRDTRVNPYQSPGPGSYEITPAFDQRTCSFRGKDIKSVKIQNPGPGTYQSQTGFSKKTYSVGKSQRFFSRSPAKGNPGPGTYEEVKSHFKKEGRPVFGSFERPGLYQYAESPGPGRYDAKYPHQNPKVYSVKGKYQKKTDTQTPGPGHYQWKKQTERPKTSAFGGAKREGARDDRLRHEFPGPGKYESKSKIESPDWRFGTGGRLEVQKRPTIGPGHYEYKSLIGNTPAYAK